MRIKAPMMSWGNDPSFSIRGSRTEPTKSAIVGLICAALGRPRSEAIADLTALKLGVRVDREGEMLSDFQTIEKAIRFGGKEGSTTVTTRYFVADAEYLVGLEGDRDLLAQIDAALECPKWQLYFGRKSFVPSCPVQIPDGVVDLDLEQALTSYPTRSTDRLRYVLEVDRSRDLRRDVPIDSIGRRFASRYVETKYRSSPILEIPVSNFGDG